uniref:F-box/kelch-repeat protein At3g06240-like n=1 Tax=Erigeron canadensis TaxID=72917 RepID=UPI001CB94C48|nr:F-box/kelch-repeat protein At3g06240-like [Erigeron canadensis]
MEKLPCDILPNIFVGLPSKELAQMRCVSKLFYALLSQPDFFKTHLIHSTQNHKKDDEIVLVFNHANKDKPFTAHILKSPEIQVNHLIKLPHNFPSPDSFNNNDSCVFGSVNGLICFYTTLSCRFRPHFIHIWNPSLPALVTLPKLEPDVYPVEYCRFGYDPKTDDYKVVKLPYDFLTDDLVEVYSMKKHSWKSVNEKFPANKVTSEIVSLNEVCIDGHDGRVHWLRRHVVDHVEKFLEIIAFDLGAETFSLISLPESISKLAGGYKRRYGFALGYWAGKLCVTAHVRYNGFHEFEVWVMNEYGVAESWVKHRDVSSQISGTNYIDPIGFTLDNKFLYGVGSHLASYDPDSTQVAYFSSCPRDSACTKVVHYIDSLVWVAPRKRMIVGVAEGAESEKIQKKTGKV